MNPDRSTEPQVPEKHNGEKSKEDEERILYRKFEIKNAQPYKGKTKKTNKNVGDKHGAVIKSRLRLKALSAYRTRLVHFQWMQYLQGFRKHMPFPATRAGHGKYAADTAHRKDNSGRMSRKDIIYGNLSPGAEN
jgi:hypothetical protein